MKEELLPFCKCGCGGRVSKPGNRFIKGHYFRCNNPMKDPTVVKKRPSRKGKTAEEIYGVVEAQRLAENKSEKMKGKCKGQKRPTMCGENNPMCRPEQRARMLGSNNPSWQGGISESVYSDDWLEVGESIRQRDNHTCRLCGRHQKQNEALFSVHHIDYNKENNDLENLITLCVSCHGKTGFNRDRWKNFFNIYLFCKNGVTTMFLQEIVKATVANHFISSEMVEGIV